MDVFLNLKFLSLIQNTCIIISNQFPGIQCSKIFYIVLYIGMKELTQINWLCNLNIKTSSVCGNLV